MPRSEDPVADRAAQLTAAFAVYSAGVNTAMDERRRAIDQADADFDKTEKQLFADYSERKDEIMGPMPAPPADEHRDNDSDA